MQEEIDKDAIAYVHCPDCVVKLPITKNDLHMMKKLNWFKFPMICHKCDKRTNFEMKDICEY